MARVNVDQIALTDARYNALGKLLGSNRHDALGRMIVVWNQCQERASYVLSVENLNSLFTDCENFSELLLKCGLGKAHRHGVYISGTRGRIEWLERKRVAARKNGKQHRSKVGTNNEPTKNQDRLQAADPLALALSPAPALTEKKKTTPSELKKKSATKTEVPEDFWPSPEMWAKAKIATGMSDFDMNERTKRFVTDRRAKGVTYKRVELGWWNWITERFGSYSRQQTLPRVIRTAPLKDE